MSARGTIVRVAGAVAVLGLAAAGAGACGGGGGGGRIEVTAYFDAAVMLLFLLLIGRWLDHQLRAKAKSAAADLLAMQAPVAAVLGADGLEVRQGRLSIWCEAIPVERVADTCGSGDMVSVGLAAKPST